MIATLKTMPVKHSLHTFAAVFSFAFIAALIFNLI